MNLATIGGFCKIAKTVRIGVGQATTHRNMSRNGAGRWRAVTVLGRKTTQRWLKTGKSSKKRDSCVTNQTKSDTALIKRLFTSLRMTGRHLIFQHKKETPVSVRSSKGKMEYLLVLAPELDHVYIDPWG